MEEKIKNKLLELRFIDSFYYDSILSVRIDKMYKNELYNLYKLRLKISTENNNIEGIKLCNEYLENISKCEGEQILSILITTENTSKSFFSDEKIKIIW